MDDLTAEPQAENLASEIIRENLSKYLAEVIRSQFPSYMDGLKKVQLRFLWAAREGQFNTETKSIIVTGAVQKYHNYGDASAYEALVRMAQSWNTNPPIIRLIGNKGSYSGDKSAKSRYTAMEITPFARDVFFGVIELSALPMIAGMDDDPEPAYFIPSIPTAMLYDNLSIGYGFQSNTVALNLGNVCDLVSAYGMHQNKFPHKPFDYTKHAEKFLPDFPNVSILTNSQELMLSYKNGVFETKIALDGNVELRHDRILLRSLPDAALFTGAKTVIQNLILQKSGLYDGWIHAVYHAQSEVDVGNLTIELKRSVNVFEVWEHLRRVLRFSDSFTPNPNYATAKGEIIRLSLPALLAIWYEKRQTVVMSSKRKKLEKLQKDLRVVEAQLIVYDAVDEVIGLIRHADTRQDAILALKKRFDISEFQAISLTRLELGELPKTTKLDFEAKRAKLTSDIAAHNHSFMHIGEEIAQEAQRIKKLYAGPRRTEIPVYIGHVAIASGLIQFTSTDELVDITTYFPKVPLSLVFYDGPHLVHVSPEKKLTRGTLSKYMRGDLYGLSVSDLSAFTVILQDGMISCGRGVIAGSRVEGYQYTGRMLRGITRKGEIRILDLEREFAPRKTMGRKTSTDLIALFLHETPLYYLVILNDKEPNIVHLHRVDGEGGKLPLSPAGEIEFRYHATGKGWYFSIPDRYLNRMNIRIVEIVDADVLLGNSRHVKLDLGTSKTKRNAHINMLV